eukprot:c15064_g1_i1.p1 GENE.c15064_g1_i1~~c15064_g1_i1.p1  ORF type:complete len:332 (+),score=35.52 c15064_g1_i1:40-1035(+)
MKRNRVLAVIFLIFLCLDGLLCSHVSIDNKKYDHENTKSYLYKFVSSLPLFNHTSQEDKINMLTKAIKYAVKHSDVIHKNIIQEHKEDFDIKLALTNLLQENSPPDYSFWTNFSVSDWGIRSDPPMISFACLFAYLMSYVGSWLTFSILIAYVVNASEIETKNNLRYVRSLTACCCLTSFGFAVLSVSCGNPYLDDSRSLCYHRSRGWFNYIWIGVVILIYGYITAFSPQKATKALEKYVLARQMKTHSKIKDEPDYETNSIYDQHKQFIAATKQESKLVEATESNPEDHSRVLLPVRSRNNLELLWYALGGFEIFTFLVLSLLCQAGSVK